MSEELSRSEVIARAVADDLTANSDTFSITFDAKYDPMPEHSLSDLKTIKLDVMDVGQKSSGRGTREDIDYEYAVAITTLLKIDNSQAMVLSKLKALAEQIADYFWFESPSGCDETLDRAEVADFGTTETLEQQGLGRMMMTLVFVGQRPKRVPA